MVAPVIAKAAASKGGRKIFKGFMRAIFATNILRKKRDEKKTGNEIDPAIRHHIARNKYQKD